MYKTCETCATRIPVKDTCQPGDKRVLIVGDSGKTKLLNALKPDPSLPDTIRAVKMTPNRTVRLDLEKVPSTPNYSELRSITYPEAKAVLLCFNVGDSSTLTSAAETWFKEVRQFNQHVPVFLVGMRCARKEVEGVSAVEVLAGGAQEVADKIKAVRYFELIWRSDHSDVEELLLAVAMAVVDKEPTASPIKK